MKNVILSLMMAALLVGCAAVPTDEAMERAVKVQNAMVAANAASVTVFRFSDDTKLASFPLAEADAAVLKELLGQGRASVYEPAFISPPAPPFAEVCLCVGSVKLNLEHVWSESKETRELEWLKKCEGEGRLAPQIVLPDAAYERFMALDAVQQAYSASERIENENTVPAS